MEKRCNENATKISNNDIDTPTSNTASDIGNTCSDTYHLAYTSLTHCCFGNNYWSVVRSSL
jgi:hypothetical protein